MNSFNYDEWHEKYQNDKIVDFKNKLEEKDYEILKRFDVIIEDKLYTLEEYEIIKQNLLNYYTDEDQEQDIENGAIIDVKNPEDKNVTREEFNKMLDRFLKVYQF